MNLSYLQIILQFYCYKFYKLNKKDPSEENKLKTFKIEICNEKEIELHAPYFLEELCPDVPVIIQQFFLAYSELLYGVVHSFLQKKYHVIFIMVGSKYIHHNYLCSLHSSKDC